MLGFTEELLVEETPHTAAAGGFQTPPEDGNEAVSRKKPDWYWLGMYRKANKANPEIYHRYYKNYLHWYSDNKCA